jgi:hypothetical protein
VLASCSEVVTPLLHKDACITSSFEEEISKFFALNNLFLIVGCVCILDQGKSLSGIIFIKCD